MTDLEKQLRDWLENQGYPLEMLVARSFSERGAGVTQSDYYIDYETGKPREIDVVARWYNAYEPLDGLDELEVFFFTECKSQQKHPWIIFSTGISKIRSYMLPPTSVDGRNLLQFVAKQESSKDLEILKIRDRAGYGLTQGFTTGKDITYEAVMSAVKAAKAEIITSDTLRKQVKDNLKDVVGIYYHPLITIPVVVTDSPLFECHLDESNLPVIKPIDYGVLDWKHPVGQRSSPHATAVYIYTSSALSKLIVHAAELYEALLINLPLHYASLTKGRKSAKIHR